MAIQIGKTASDFTLTSSDGRDLKISDFHGKKIVLYFYSKDNTSGCTKQAVELRDNIEKIQEYNAIVLGISPDTLKSHQNFIEKYQLPFLLLSDPDKEVAKLFEVYKEKKVCGKIKMGIERSTFIIDEKGIVQKIYRKVDVKKHLEQVLAALEELPSSLKEEGFFLTEDFQVFQIEGLAERMNALKKKVRPKLQALGENLAAEIRKKHRNDFFPHVAKHARRTVNPPEDTWVALGPSKLGYKMLPHFEVGLSQSQFYIKLVLKAECKSKKDFASKLRMETNLLAPLSKASYLIYGINPNSLQGKLLKEVSREEIEVILENLQTKKNAWIAIGLEFSKNQVEELSEIQLIKKIIMAINKLYPLYA